MRTSRILASLGLVAATGLWLWSSRAKRGPATGRGTAGAPSRWAERITPGTRANRPNILLVVYDARRRDDFSFGPFGNERGDTPFLSAFKDDAAYFEDAVSPGCWTVPVHASIFSGLSVADLGIDYYNPGCQAFGSRFLSLAEILGLAGYQTVAYADHPFFYNRNPRVSLIRGFEQFNVINDFRLYGSFTNVNTRPGGIEHRFGLAGMQDLSWEELSDLVLRFNQGKIRLDLSAEADYDPHDRLFLPKLYEMFQQSSYFRRRYGDEFDGYVFTAGRSRPYFLFVNLHMCTIATPDPGLYSRWFLKTLMLNAQHQGAKLALGSPERGVRGCLVSNYSRLGLRHSLTADAQEFMKHVFDNRFYDASFRGLWEYLSRRGLTRNTVAIVTSDHGMSLRENGEAIYAHNGARPYDYMTRVPLVLRLPPETSPALRGRYSEKVSLTDLFATMVELGVGPGVFERPLPIRGRSLIDRIRKREFETVLVADSSLQPLDYTLLPGLVGYSKAIYSGHLKLIYVREPRQIMEGNWPPEVRLGDTLPALALRPVYGRLEPLAWLFDLSLDPHEKNDLAGGSAARVEAMKRLVSGSWECGACDEVAETPVWDGDALETLRSLGYVR